MKRKIQILILTIATIFLLPSCYVSQLNKVYLNKQDSSIVSISYDGYTTRYPTKSDLDRGIKISKLYSVSNIDITPDTSTDDEGRHIIIDNKFISSLSDKEQYNLVSATETKRYSFWRTFGLGLGISTAIGIITGFILSKNSPEVPTTPTHVDDPFDPWD